MKANTEEIMEAKWAINSIHNTYHDTEMYVDEVVDFMDVKPRKGAEADAVKKGAVEYGSEFGERIKIISPSKKRNPVGRALPWTDYMWEWAEDMKVSTVVDMHLDKFISLTIGDIADAQDIQKEAAPLAVYEKHIDQMLPLFLKVQEDGKVIGHDGRHRAAAMLNAKPRQFTAPVAVIIADEDGYADRAYTSKDLPRFWKSQFKPVRNYAYDEVVESVLVPALQKSGRPDKYKRKNPMAKKKYKLHDPESNRTVNWTVAQILKEINRDRKFAWHPYTESDWKEGLRDWTEWELITQKKRKNPMAKRKRNPAKNCSKNERFVTFSDGREVCFPASPKRKRKRKPAKKRTVRRVTRTTKVTYSSAKKKKKPAIRSSKPVTIPKGKRKGDHFTKNGKHYTVVSYIRDGKRMRFARLVGSKCAVKKSGGRRRNPVLTNPRKKRLTKAAYLKEVKRLANENLPYIRSEKLNSYINNDVDNSPIYRKSENHELILKYSDFPGRFEEIFLEDEIADRLAEDGPEGILDDKAYHAMSEDVEALVYALSQRGR
jgi:hypothetical protein